MSILGFSHTQLYVADSTDSEGIGPMKLVVTTIQCFHDRCDHLLSSDVVSGRSSQALVQPSTNNEL